MTLQAVLEPSDFEDVPEAVRGEYKKQTVKKDGKETEIYVLDVSGINEHPTVQGLKSGFDRSRGQVNELKTRVAELEGKLKDLPDDFDPAHIVEMRDRIAELEAELAADDDKNPEKKKERGRLLEQKIANLEKKHADAIAAKDKEIAKRDQRIERMLVDDGLTKALIDAGVAPKFMKAAKALLRQDAKVVNEGDEPKAIVETDMGPVSLAKYVSDWAESDEGKEYVEKAKGSGGSGSGKNGDRDIKVNPFDSKTMNLTEQGKIIQSDRTLARKLMVDAKWSQDKIDKRLNAS